MRTLTASKVYLAITGAMSLAQATMFTTYVVYYVEALGFNPLQLLLVGTVLEATVFLLEIPTGVVADAYSRRLSVIIGMFVLGAGYLLQGSILFMVPTLAKLAISYFAMVLASEIVRAFGETFLSGALEAWITDEVGEEAVGALFLRANQVGHAAGLIGTVLSVWLASVALNLPYFVGGLIFLALGLFLVLAMPETGFRPAPRDGYLPFQVMGTTFRDGVRAVRGRPVLAMVLLVSMIGGAASEGYDRLWGAHLLTNLTVPQLGSLQPVVWFGIISIAGSLVSILAVQIARGRLDTTDNRVLSRSLIVFTALRIACIVSFALAPTFAWALASLLAIGVVGSLSGPLYRTWLNQNIDSRVRATVLSMMGQTDALGQTAGGPVVGLVGARLSIRAALVLAAVLLSPAIGVYLRALRRGRAYAGGSVTHRR